MAEPRFGSQLPDDDPALMKTRRDIVIALAEARARQDEREAQENLDRIWKKAGFNGHTNGASPVVPIPEPKTPMPEQASSEAFYGLLGDLAQLTQDYVESDASSILFQLLCTFGIAAGVQPHFMIGATRHAPALFVANIGKSSRGRKGTGWEPIETMFRGAEPEFADRIMSGIGSGEKLVHLVRDPDGDDLGSTDRRLLLRESELARLLVVVNREGSTLSAYLREAFDGKPIRNEVKGRPARSTQHHIGMIGHCTVDEVQSKLREEQIRNGLANRVLWVSSKRARKLPNPPRFSCYDSKDVDEATARLHDAIGYAKSVTSMSRSPEAQAIWDEWYISLDDNGVGPVATITERAEALVTRISMVFALSDGSPTILPDHLCAALAVWDYSAACVRSIWGGTTGDIMADRVLEELAYGPMLQSEITSAVFGGHVSGQRLTEVGALLERQGRVVRDRVETGNRGRPAIRWSLNS